MNNNHTIIYVIDIAVDKRKIKKHINRIRKDHIKKIKIDRNTKLFGISIMINNHLMFARSRSQKHNLLYDTVKELLIYSNYNNYNNLRHYSFYCKSELFKKIGNVSLPRYIIDNVSVTYI